MALSPVLSSLNDLTGHGAVGQRLTPDSAGRPAWRDAEIINVREYGILGDGSDEYATIQALLDAIADGTTRRRRLVFPESSSGDYYTISDTLTPDNGEIAIEGVGPRKSRIQQTTPNIPILQWTSDQPNGIARDIRVANLSLSFEDAPDGTTTQQYAIQFRSSADGSATSGAGYYLMHFENLDIYRAYVGIGAYATGTGTCPLWSTHFENLTFRDTKHHAIKLTNTPGTGSLGQPANVFTNINVLNYGTGFLSDDAAIAIASGTGVTINGLNVEDWQNQILYIVGGSFTTINGLRTERHDLTTNGGFDVLYLSNGVFTLNGVDFQNLRFAHTSGVARLIRAANSAKVIVNGVICSRSSSSTSTQTTALAWAPAGTEVTVNGALLNDAYVTRYLGNAYGDGQHGLVQYNGKPPVWDSEPAASSTYRGRIYRTEGGTGVADVVRICTKDAADAYGWRDLI